MLFFNKEKHTKKRFSSISWYKCISNNLCCVTVAFIRGPLVAIDGLKNKRVVKDCFAARRCLYIGCGISMYLYFIYYVGIWLSGSLTHTQSNIARMCGYTLCRQVAQNNVLSYIHIFDIPTINEMKTFFLNNNTVQSGSVSCTIYIYISVCTYNGQNI